MILTCPECATSYFVDDSRIPPEGRRVKCSSCGHRWRAGPEGTLAEEPVAAPEPVALAEEPAADAVAPEAEAEVVPAPAEPEPLAPTFRRPVPARPVKRDEGRSGALVWAGAAAVAAALIAGAIVFREQIVRVLPASSAAYAGLGLSVSGGGLVFEQVRVQPAFLAGRPVLSVTGAIHNVRDVPVETPPVRVTLLNRAGQPVAAKISRPMDATIPAKATRHFVITVLDPPAAARDLEVRFEDGRGVAAKATPRAAEAVLAPAAPQTPPGEESAAPVSGAPISGAPISGAPLPAAPPEPRLSPAAATEHG